MAMGASMPAAAAAASVASSSAMDLQIAAPGASPEQLQQWFLKLSVNKEGVLYEVGLVSRVLALGLGFIASGLG